MRRTPVFVIFLTVFIDLLGFGMVVPLLSRYAENYGATPFLSGLLVASYSLAQFVFAPMWGRLSDRVGRKPVLSWTLAGNTIAYGLFASAGGLPTAFVLPMLFFSRSLSGFFAANISTAQAYVADVTTKADRAKGMGMIGMAFGLGFVLGPAMGGILAGRFGTWAPGAAAALLSATACAVATFRLPESLTPALRASASRRKGHPILELRNALGNPRISGIFLLFFFLVFGFANLESMLALFLNHRFGFDEEHSGYVFVYIGVCISFTQGFLIGRLSKRFGDEFLLKTAPLLLAVGMQLYWLMPNFELFLIAVPCVALGMGLSNPTVATIISKRTPPDAQGRTLGLSQSLGALARALSPALAGWLYETYPQKGGSIVPFIWGGALVVLGLLLGLPALRRRDEGSDAE